MRDILLLNPNTNASMSQRMASAAARLLPSDVRLDTATGRFGFPVVATRTAYAVAAHAALDAYANHDGNCDAILLSCFGDPGLEALRELAPCPVVGLAEASIRAAEVVGKPFAILTVGLPWIAMLEERVAAARPTVRCAGIFAVEGARLDYVGSPESAIPLLNDLARQAVSAGAHSLILGGGVLVGMSGKFTTKAHYIDCMEAAVGAIGTARKPQTQRPRQAAPVSGLSEHLAKLVQAAD